LSDQSDKPAPGPNVLVIRAVFVPDGGDPPPDFLANIDPLRFRATYDPSTGELTCDEAGNAFDGAIQAQWYPAVGEEADAENVPGAPKAGGRTAQ
jgi:hypothetical protein